MLEFSNVKVYDLRESIISCRNAMRIEAPDYNSEEEFNKGLDRAKKLLDKEYEKAKTLEYVHNPLAYALFNVWRKADRESRKEQK